MSRGSVTVILVCLGLLIWFYIVGQMIQGIEIAFALGLIIGTLFGLWIGGDRVIQKQYRDDIEGAKAKKAKNKEKYL